jgi:uncharacterized repeat protein (TIGR03803 family)
MKKQLLLLGCALVFVYALAQTQPVFYGMTHNGGANNKGVIFSFDATTGKYTKHYDFEEMNGESPFGGLIQGADGKLYGMTTRGGTNEAGVIFSFDPRTDTYKKLFDFDDNNGSGPQGNLLQASDGKLYGMTWGGGYGDSEETELYGVFFSFNPVTAQYEYTALANVADITGIGANGSLIQATNGKLYGLTQGGIFNILARLFSYDPITKTFSKLIAFEGENGYDPGTSVIQARDGILYGLTRGGGGLPNEEYSYYGGGTIFSLDPRTNSQKKLFVFDEQDEELTPNGTSPSGSLLQATDGKLYGTAQGGINKAGVLFSFDPATHTYAKLFDFSVKDGSKPAKQLTEGSDGKLYGMTSDGGSMDKGVIFSFDPVTKKYAKLLDFNSANGANPAAELMIFKPCTQDPITYYQDKDMDGYGNADAPLVSCTQPQGFVTNKGDCNDNNDKVHPGATGRCNGIDDDCDGKIDEACTGPVWYRDADGDGFGNSSDSTHYPTKQNGWVSNKLDCNDKNKVKGGPEVCDGIDNDCDGVIDNGLTERTFYSDYDGDGYGSEKRTITTCAAPPRYVAVGGDCNDDNANVHPGAPELCDGRDNDCNGEIDDGLTLKPFYWDADKDGYGFFRPVYACAAPPGYIAQGGDCNDNNYAIHPGAEEQCNGIDEDCDGIIDNGFAQKRYYKDQDGDGWGSNSNLMAGCAPLGYVEKSDDCNDNNPGVHPEAIEVSGNGVDENCNGQVDEPTTTVVTLYGMMAPYQDEAGGNNTSFNIYTFIPAIPKAVQWLDFKGVDIQDLSGSLVKAADGKLYGVASYGGSLNGGVIFSFDPRTATYAQHWEFKFDYGDYSSDTVNGSHPSGTLLQATDGNLYGTTYEGGVHNKGVLFAFNPLTGTFSKLHDFDSANTYNTSLVQASDGKIYGVGNGGVYNDGLLFSFDPASRVYTKVYDFDGQAGVGPSGGLLQASDGKLYGVAGGGANRAGVVYGFDLVTQKVAKLVDFEASNGANPTGTMVQASDGKLYGTTNKGGANDAGTIFSVDLANTKLTKLWDFAYQPYALYAIRSELMEASDGNLYGTSFIGESDARGIIFRFNPLTRIFSEAGQLATPIEGGGIPTGRLIEYEPACKLTYYQDRDKDSYGNSNVAFSLDACFPPEGYVTNDKDCNDNDASVHPRADDYECNDIDNNCNGIVDDYYCEEVITKAGKITTEQGTPALHLSVSPNPSRNYFTIRVESSSYEPVQLHVIDNMGRVIEVRKGMTANSTLFIGQNFRPGVYYVEVLQNGKHATIMLLKQTP